MQGRVCRTPYSVPKRPSSYFRFYISSMKFLVFCCRVPLITLVISSYDACVSIPLVPLTGDGGGRPVVHERGGGQHAGWIYVGVCRRAQQPSGKPRASPPSLAPVTVVHVFPYV